MRTMSTKRLTTVEAARELETTPEEVYRLIFAGEIDGRPDAQGIVRVDGDAIGAYRAAHPPQTN